MNAVDNVPGNVDDKNASETVNEVQTIPRSANEDKKLNEAPTNKIENERFIFLDEDAVQQFIQSKQNVNTLKKTIYDIKLVKLFLKSKNDERELHKIPPRELDSHLANFILSVRKKDLTEFEPNSLRGLMSSVDRHLKGKLYGSTIMKATDTNFELTRAAMKAKQRDLKAKGKGNRTKTQRSDQ